MRMSQGQYRQPLVQKRTGGRFKKVGGFLLILLLILLVFGNWKISQARKKISLKVREMSEELQKIEQDKESLQVKILQSDNYNYLEKIAREELNFKKEGESVVAFPDQKLFQETEVSQKIRSLWQEFFEMRKKEKENKTQ
ncbi:MAG: septum formation initiator family protein [Candidatus Pacebacteria bacterium]|nr:septum formation initiator family protein [Candidatus Paceibacterota bacterium]